MIVVAGLALVELDGFLSAEKREERMRREYAFRGETIPEEIVPPRNLRSPRTRRWMRVISLAAFVTALASLVLQVTIS